MLREHLKRLPDFEDVAAEERALTLVRGSVRVDDALAFLLAWPDLARAADFVLARSGEIDGNDYETLVPAAEALDARHPLAATVVRRALIDFTLEKARATRYRHAARHLLECRSLVGRIEDFGTLPDHEAYVAGLKVRHGRKAAFWEFVSRW